MWGRLFGCFGYFLPVKILISPLWEQGETYLGEELILSGSKVLNWVKNTVVTSIKIWGQYLHNILLIPIQQAKHEEDEGNDEFDESMQLYQEEHRNRWET